MTIYNVDCLVVFAIEIFKHVFVLSDLSQYRNKNYFYVHKTSSSIYSV